MDILTARQQVFLSKHFLSLRRFSQHFPQWDFSSSSFRRQSIKGVTFLERKVFRPERERGTTRPTRTRTHTLTNRRPLSRRPAKGNQPERRRGTHTRPEEESTRRAKAVLLLVLPLRRRLRRRRHPLRRRPRPRALLALVRGFGGGGGGLATLGAFPNGPLGRADGLQIAAEEERGAQGRARASWA